MGQGEGWRGLSPAGAEGCGSGWQLSHQPLHASSGWQPAQRGTRSCPALLPLAPQLRQQSTGIKVRRSWANRAKRLKNT